MVKNLNWYGTSQLAVNFYKRGRGFELTTTENKSSNRSEYDLNSGPLNCTSSALTTRQAASYQFSMLILKRDIIAVKIVMLGSTKCVCEWETEKGSVLEAKHQQFYMRAHCSNVATTSIYTTKMKNSSVCLTESFSKATDNIRTRRSAWQSPTNICVGGYTYGSFVYRDLFLF